MHAVLNVRINRALVSITLINTVLLTRIKTRLCDSRLVIKHAQHKRIKQPSNIVLGYYPRLFQTIALKQAIKLAVQGVSRQLTLHVVAEVTNSNALKTRSCDSWLVIRYTQHKQAKTNQQYYLEYYHPDFSSKLLKTSYHE